MHPTTSPSKAAYGRTTYDSKLMHRLGTAPSSSTNLLPNPSLVQVSLSNSTSSNDPWGMLHVNLLPLFNGEPLRVPIEDLNLLVKRHISSIVSSMPSKALSTLENDTVELLSSGMVTLNAKLSGIEDDKMISRVVELWGFFWDQVLTYVEGVLLPLQTDPLLSTLYRTPKRPSSPTRQTSKPSISSSLALTGHGMSPYHIDVRTVALRSFRDKVILPLSARLHTRLSILSNQNKTANEMVEIPPKMQQMLLVLSAQSRPRPQTLSLGISGGPIPPHLSTGEAAITSLLLIVRSASRLHHSSKSFSRRPGHISGPSISSRHHHPSFPSHRTNGSNALSGTGPGTGSERAPNFLSGGTPRDRRGRIAGKKLTIVGDAGMGSKSAPLNVIAVGGSGDHDPNDSGDIDTPRNASSNPNANSSVDTFGFAFSDIDRQRERDFLDSLRSPDLPPGTPTGSSTTARASVGGWGLGAGNESTMLPGEGEEDEPLDWDEAQAVVERMVGMNSTQQQQENGFAAHLNSVLPTHIPPVRRRS